MHGHGASCPDGLRLGLPLLCAAAAAAACCWLPASCMLHAPVVMICLSLSSE
jgi:hypothetical protein